MILQYIIITAITLAIANITYNSITYSRRFSKPIFQSRIGITLIITAITLEILCQIFGVL